ncbi:LysR family transcriptional regulator [Alicyclobacillus fodiniaquatilis]|uniref:LysR family transcriptional regulator n=1 Tax=Alicyclobacillus fodiniaquatilis TaxID=1661150 RepID=A0ABW4JSM6_9BACL
MDFEELQSFMVVAREKSISSAARALHVTQPTLSMRLQRLERGLGVKLLERKWDGVQLTKQGQFFLSYSAKLLQNMEEAATLMSRQESHELTPPFNAITDSHSLRIGIDNTLCPALIETMIEEMHAINPDIDCKFVTDYSDLMLNLTGHEELHLCIYFGGNLEPSVHTLSLFEDELALIYPYDGYPRIEADLSNVWALEDKPFVLLSGSPLIGFRDMVGQAFINMYGRVPNRYHIVDNMQVLFDIVKYGAGYSFVSVTNMLHLLDKPLPFRMIRLGKQYPTPLLYLSYAKQCDHVFPIEQIAKRLHARLLRKISHLSNA